MDKADQQVGQRSGLGRLDGPLQVGDRHLAETLEGADPVEVQVVDVGHVGEQPGLARTTPTVRSPRPSMSMAAPRGEVGDALHPLAGAVDVDAEGVALAFEADQGLRRRPGSGLGTPTPADPRGAGPAPGPAPRG